MLAVYGRNDGEVDDECHDACSLNLSNARQICHVVLLLVTPVSGCEGQREEAYLHAILFGVPNQDG